MGYASSRRSAAVSRHTVVHLTRDAFEAEVYAQTWAHRETGARTQFDVLAFRDQAEDHGAIRLFGMDAKTPLAKMVLVENRLVSNASKERKEAVLAVEELEERDTRRAEWKRQEDGPGDPDPNGTSAGEVMDRAYETDRRLR